MRVPLANHHRRNAIIPRVATAEFHSSQVANAGPEILLTASEVAIIENRNPGPSVQLNRGDVISKLARQGI